MNILGISALDKESSATLLKNGKIIAACAEERFSRIKQQDGFPHQALNYVLQEGGLNISDIDIVAYPFLGGLQECLLMWKCFLINIFETLWLPGPLPERILHLVNYLRITILNSKNHLRYDRELRRNLKALGLIKKLKYIDHQLAHCAAAYYTSGFSDALLVSMDAYGSGLSTVVYEMKNGAFKALEKIPYPHSMGGFYYRVTKALGFKPDRHEGKILGLAAYGNPKTVKTRLLAYFRFGNGRYRFGTATNFFRDKQIAKSHSREDVAAGYQAVLEDITQNLVETHLHRTGHTKIALAGGVFANVKLNQRIAEIEGVKKVFIHPAMSDSGSGTGAALVIAHQHGEATSRLLDDVYLGPCYSETEILKSLNSYQQDVIYQKATDIHKQIAEFLADKKVVAHFDGRMEYGPRSLGNRSILYHATDPSVNKWLNHQLKRTEFMPFAPATLADHAKTYYKDYDIGEYAARFMTITFDCTEKMIQSSPAAVHVDKTARPQILHKKLTPRFYGILDEYHKITGIPTVINTSFNMHEEPIVCSPDDALRAFVQSGLDILILNDYIVKLRSNIQ